MSVVKIQQADEIEIPSIVRALYDPLETTFI